MYDATTYIYKATFLKKKTLDNNRNKKQNHS